MVKILAALSLATLFSSPAMAQENKGYGDEWQHAFALYGWGVDIGGQSAGRGRDRIQSVPLGGHRTGLPPP